MPATEWGPVPQSTRGVEFAEFFRATWPRLFRTTYAVAGDRLLAEESLQANLRVPDLHAHTPSRRILASPSRRAGAS